MQVRVTQSSLVSFSIITATNTRSIGSASSANDGSDFNLIHPEANTSSRILRRTLIRTNPRENYSDNWIVDIKWAAIGTGTRSQTLSFIHRRRHDPQHTRHGSLAKPMRPRKVKKKKKQVGLVHLNLPISIFIFLSVSISSSRC